jgi:hypothetical protein
LLDHANSDIIDLRSLKLMLSMVRDFIGPIKIQIGLKWEFGRQEELLLVPEAAAGELLSGPLAVEERLIFHNMSTGTRGAT